MALEVPSSQPLFSTHSKISLLKDRVRILQNICNEIDPFGEISEEHRNLLSELGSFDFSDPFDLTNQLIVMTENILEEIHHLEQ